MWTEIVLRLAGEWDSQWVGRTQDAVADIVGQLLVDEQDGDELRENDLTQTEWLDRLSWQIKDAENEIERTGDADAITLRTIAAASLAMVRQHGMEDTDC